MYYFLAMLAVTDLGLCMSTLPSVLGMLWFDAWMVGLVHCVLQQHFLPSSSFMESAVLFAMALDHLVAIQFPLCYASVLRSSCGIGWGCAGHAECHHHCCTLIASVEI